MLNSRLDLSLTTHGEAQSPFVRANLKARLQAQFPFALTAREWDHTHCIWTNLPRAVQRACASTAASISNVVAQFNTTVRERLFGEVVVQHLQRLHFVHAFPFRWLLRFHSLHHASHVLLGCWVFLVDVMCPALGWRQVVSNPDGGESVQCAAITKELRAQHWPVDGPHPIFLSTTKDFTVAEAMLRENIERCDKDEETVRLLVQLATVRTPCPL